jgi:Uncharacterised nucleotidyltransferase
LRAPLNWPALISFADDHGVLGLTAARLLDHNESAIPPESHESVRNWRRAQALFTLNMTAEMFRLFESFPTANLEALVIKGPVLSVRCYGDPALRQYGDLDLIVRDKDVLRTSKLMISLGYEPTVPLGAIHAKKIPGEYNFRQKTSRLLIEFHTELTFRYHPRPLPLEHLFERSTPVSFDSREVPALCPEDELILICVHGAKHFWERLIYVADVAAFVCVQKLDWALVESAAEEVGAKRMLYVGLQLAADLLGAPLPESLQAQMQSDVTVRPLAKQIIRWLPEAGWAPRGIWERAMFRTRMHGRALAGLAYLFRLSFSPTEEDWAKGDEEKRPWLLDALGRPLRLARKYGRDGKT